MMMMIMMMVRRDVFYYLFFYFFPDMNNNVYCVMYPTYTNMPIEHYFYLFLWIYIFFFVQKLCSLNSKHLFFFGTHAHHAPLLRVRGTVWMQKTKKKKRRHIVQGKCVYKAFFKYRDKYNFLIFSLFVVFLFG